MLHLGTLCSVFVVFWRRILALLTEDRRVIPLLIIGTIPIVVVGLPLEKFFPGLMESPLLAGFCFIGTACLLLFSDHRQKSETGERLYRDLTVRDALFVGAFQAIAILPGFSRSGFTIVGALLCKLRRDEAATFSFLLSIPAIMGAGIYETIKLVRKAYSPEPEPIEGFWLIFAGAVLSFIVGIIALKWLMAWLQKGRLHYFAYWLLILGPFMIVLMLCFPLASKTNGENGAEPTPVQQIEQNTPTESSEETEEPESSAENTETTEPVASTKPEHVQTIIAHLDRKSVV